MDVNYPVTINENELTDVEFREIIERAYNLGASLQDLTNLAADQAINNFLEADQDRFHGNMSQVPQGSSTDLMRRSHNSRTSEITFQETPPDIQERLEELNRQMEENIRRQNDLEQEREDDIYSINECSDENLRIKMREYEQLVAERNSILKHLEKQKLSTDEIKDQVMNFLKDKGIDCSKIIIDIKSAVTEEKIEDRTIEDEIIDLIND